MLNKAIADKLNEQINLEFYSSNVYYSHLCNICKINSHYQIKNDEIW